MNSEKDRDQSFARQRVDLRQDQSFAPMLTPDESGSMDDWEMNPGAFSQSVKDDLLLSNADAEKLLTAIELYSKTEERKTINEIVETFAQNLGDTWRGPGERFHRQINYLHYLRELITICFLGVIIVAASCWHMVSNDKIPFVAPWVPSVGFVGLLLIIAWAMHSKLEDQWKTLHLQLDKEIDDFIRSNNDDKESALNNLPTDLRTDSAKDIAASNLFLVLRSWRIMERVPHYLRFKVMEYRFRAQRNRLAKELSGLILIALLGCAVVAKLAAFSLAPDPPVMTAPTELKGEIFSWGSSLLGASQKAFFGDNLLTQELCVFFSLITGLLSGALYLITLKRWKDKSLEVIVHALNIGVSPDRTTPFDQIEEAPKKEDDLRIRISNYDPAQAIAKKYQQVRTGQI